MNSPILSEWSGDIKFSNAELVVCPPFTHIDKLANLLKKTKVKLGSQDIFWENQGAYTGEISPTMLKKLGVEYVIVGHSERRKYLNETDEMINKKVLGGLKAGLKVILCVGEPQKNIKAAKNYIKKQLEKDLGGIKNCKLKIKNLIVAYEPIWAISGNKNSRPDTRKNALEMIKFIKNILHSKFHILDSCVLYGGSVNGKNIKSFVKYKEIDGALVGGASLKKDEVKKIINSIK